MIVGPGCDDSLPSWWPQPDRWTTSFFRDPPQKTPWEIATELAVKDARAFAAAQPFLSRNLARAASANPPLPFWVTFDGGHYDPREKIACYREAYAATLLSLAR